MREVSFFLFYSFAVFVEVKEGKSLVFSFECQCLYILSYWDQKKLNRNLIILISSIPPHNVSSKYICIYSGLYFNNFIFTGLIFRKSVLKIFVLDEYSIKSDDMAAPENKNKTRSKKCTDPSAPVTIVLTKYREQNPSESASVINSQ